MQSLKSMGLAMAIATIAGAGIQAQSITWLTKETRIKSGDWYLPQLANDLYYDYVVVGQGGTGFADLKDQTANYPAFSNPETLTWAGTYTRTIPPAMLPAWLCMSGSRVLTWPSRCIKAARTAAQPFGRTWR